MPFDPDDLVELVDALSGVELGTGAQLSVSMRPGSVNTPGVWVQLRAFVDDLLSGTTLDVELHAVVGETETDAAMRELADLWRAIAPVVRSFGGPTGGRVEAELLQLPDRPALPALRIPVLIHTTTEGS